jgi:hypothetical protein
MPENDRKKPTRCMTDYKSFECHDSIAASSGDIKSLTMDPDIQL